MPTLKQIYDFINLLAPYSLQESYDNSGINVGDDDKPIKRILCALDVTNEIAAEAAECGADLVLTHHPVIFKGLKRLDMSLPAVRLAVSGIAAISMHTNFDIAKGGMNDLLCEKLGLMPEENLSCENGIGIGYICSCNEIAANELAKNVKTALGCRVVRFCRADKNVSKIAVCSGSGGGFLSDAIAKGCDAFITGDVKHDAFIDAHNAGICLIDAGHFYTENIFFDFISKKLTENFPDIEILCAKSNTDPVSCL